MRRMVIVDDESRIRRGLRNCIDWEALGISIQGEAGSGKEALGLIMETRPDIIITDIKMPDLDGIALIKTVRDMGIESAVIIISGYDDFDFAQAAIRYGVTDYILKPVNERELLERIRNCLGRLESAEASPGYAESIAADMKKGNILIDKAIEFIRDNYGRDISLNEVADSVSIHPNYLSSLFVEVVGENYSKYLAKLRISKAKELLKDPRFKVFEVSGLVGYADYRRFAKLFKAYEGMTPMEYRKTLAARS